MNRKRQVAGKMPGYLGLVAGIALVIYLLGQIDLSASAHLIGLIGPASVLILLPYLILHLIETVAWKWLFPPGIYRLPFLELLRVQLIGETVSMTLPAGATVGEPLRPWLCRRFMGIPLPTGFATVTVRKILLGAAQGIYTLIAAIAGFSVLQEVSSDIIGFEGLGVIQLLAGILVMTTFMLFVTLMTGGNAMQHLHRYLMMVPFDWAKRALLKVEAGFTETDHQLSMVRNNGIISLLPVLLMYVAAWMMLALESYLILQLMGVEVTFLQVLAFDSALAILRATLFFIPSGLGVQDLGYLAFFQALGIPDYLAYGGAFVLIRRLKEVVWYTIGYGVMFTSGVHIRDAQKASGEET